MRPATLVEHIPVEGSSVATRPSRAGRRLRIEQDHVRAARVLLRASCVIGRRDRNGLDDRASKSLLDRRDAFRRSRSMKLKKVRRNLVNDLRERRIIGIDRQSHDLDFAAGMPRQFACLGDFEVARALCTENKADVVGAASNGRVQRFPRRDPANLCFDCHRV